jgi:hypothetical protein
MKTAIAFLACALAAHAAGIDGRWTAQTTVSGKKAAGKQLTYMATSMNVTARVYSHALPGDDKRATDTWGTIIKGPLR